jgi:hypothetical protein
LSTVVLNTAPIKDDNIDNPEDIFCVYVFWIVYDDKYWTSRENSLKLIELSSVNKIIV